MSNVAEPTLRTLLRADSLAEQTHVMKASLLPNWDLGQGTEVLLWEQGYCSHPLSGITHLTEKFPQTCPAQNPAPPWVQGKDMGYGP